MQHTVRFATLATALLVLGTAAAQAAPPCPTEDSCVLVEAGEFTFDASFDPISYKIVGSLGVAPGVTLTIPKGTKLYFARDVGFTVNGRLLIEGTEQQPVLMTSLAENPTRGDWAGINFMKSVGSLIQHADILNASDPITGEDSSVSVINSTLDVPAGSHSGIELIRVPVGSEVRIVDNVITGGDSRSADPARCQCAGIRISQKSPLLAPGQEPELRGEILLNQVRGFPSGIHTSGFSTTIELNMVMDNQNGIVADIYTEELNRRITARAFGSPEIMRNVVTKNSRDGIETQGGRPRIEGNTVTDNDGAGISVSGGSAQILRNTIMKNTSYGVYLGEEPFFEGREDPHPVLTGNELLENNRSSSIPYDLLNDVPATYGRIDAKGNYWGVENFRTIEMRIRDGRPKLLSHLAVVDICPYLGHDRMPIDFC